MTKVILLNGPAGSGKDTLGSGLCSRLPGDSIIEKFAQPIRDAALATFPFLTPETLDSWKETPFLADTPTTLRQWMISYSEDLMKPAFGEDIFGRLCAERLRETEPNFAVITDSGFLLEADVLVNCFGPDNVVLFQIERDGKTFAGDSRGYIDIEDVTTEVIYNVEDRPNIAVNEMLSLIGSDLGWLG